MVNIKDEDKQDIMAAGIDEYQIKRPLSDMLLNEEQIADLINEGAKDKNKSNAFKFIELTLALKGLSTTSANDIEVSFKGEDGQQL